MVALEIAGGMVFFVPTFIGLGVLVGRLSEKNHTGLAFMVLAVGLFALLILTATYGHAVR